MPQRWLTNVAVTPDAAPWIGDGGPSRQLAVVPVDRSGMVRLEPGLRNRLKIDPTVRPREPGFEVPIGEAAKAVAYLTVPSEQGEDAVQTIEYNLGGLLSADAHYDYGRTWLPLTIFEEAGPDRGKGLELILKAMRAAPDRQGTHPHQFTIAIINNVSRDELISLRSRVESAAGRPLRDVKGALLDAEIYADDSAVDLLNRAGQLIFEQKRGLDYGRINTRVFLFALLYEGRSGGAPVAQLLFRAWQRLNPEAFEKAEERYLRSPFSVRTEPAPAPVIFSQPRDALRQIADQTGSAAALAAITEARESGNIPAVGATATLVGAMELATQLAARTERLV